MMNSGAPEEGSRLISNYTNSIWMLFSVYLRYRNYIISSAEVSS